MTRFFASFALAAAAFALAPQPLRAADALCPRLNATKHGTYVVYGTGTIVGVGPAVAVGEINYDGHGNTLATFTLNVNGNVQTNTAVPGTYTINSDCTGTSLEAGAHYNFVVSPDGNTTTWMETDPGTVVSGTEVRLKPAELFGRSFEPSSSDPKSPEKKDAAQVPVAQPAKNRAMLRKGTA